MAFDNQKYTPIFMHDYSKIREVFGISLPQSDSGQSVKDYLTSLFTTNSTIGGGSPINGGFISGYDRGALPGPINKTNVGYDQTQIDADIFYQSGESYYEGIIGRFDPQQTKNAFKSQLDWTDKLKTSFTSEKYHNVDLYTWGDAVKANSVESLTPPHIDLMGQARPLAITPTNIFYSDSTEHIKGMIDAAPGKLSLADNPAYADLAYGLTKLGAYSATIPGNTNVSMIGYVDSSNSPLMRKYNAVGSGIGRDEKGTYIVLVLNHESAQLASDNLAILRNRIDHVVISRGSDVVWNWKDGVRDAQISNEGKLLLAKLYCPDGSKAIYWLQLGTYPLLSHE